MAKTMQMCVGGGQIFGREGAYVRSDYKNLEVLKQAHDVSAFRLSDLTMSLNAHMEYTYDGEDLLVDSS